MPATLKSLTEGTKALVVPYQDDPSAVTVWSCPLSAKIERQISDLANSNGDAVSASQSLIPLFLALITKWDLPLDDRQGEVVPLTEEGIETVPYAFLMSIINAVMEEQNPKEVTAPSSSDA